MCRNIRVLHNFQPPTTEEEVHAAALQYVRKVSGMQRPSLADQAAFDQAIRRIAEETRGLLASLSARPPPRTREAEKAKARARWAARLTRLAR